MDTTNETLPHARTDDSRNRVSRRSAIKAAVAVGAAMYSAPTIDTLTARAVGAVSPPPGHGCITTCGGNATFEGGSIEIRPDEETSGNHLKISSKSIGTRGHDLEGIAPASVVAGTTNVELVVTMDGDTCTVVITGVKRDCESHTGGQMISITCTGKVPYSTGGAVPITHGTVALTTCPPPDVQDGPDERP